MSNVLGDICTSLDKLGAAVNALTADKRVLSEWHGWNHPSLNVDDLANMPIRLAKKIRNTDFPSIDKDLLVDLKNVPSRLTALETKTLPYMFNGHGHTAVPAYMASIKWVENLFEPIFNSWEVIENNPNLIPKALKRKITSLEKQIESISLTTDNLDEYAKQIINAREAAESLPSDLEDLIEARKKIQNLLINSQKDEVKISTSKETVDTIVEDIVKQEEITKKLISNIEEAYNITTSKGLAGAFSDKAKTLSWSMILWVCGLIFALLIGANIGVERISELTNVLKEPNVDAYIILVHIFLSVLSLGAPLWFAWLSTKQIGQRFRLAEDYAYKASVAKAYEGYRKEASRLDEAFEARLFSTILSRIEEAPLRLIEDTQHGSPWHELITSKIFQDTMEKVPNLKQEFIKIIKKDKGMENKAEIKESIEQGTT